MTYRSVGWVMVLGVGVTVAGGCGPSTGAGLPGAGPGSATEFFAQFCDIYRPCCQAAGLRSDGAQCRALYASLAPGSMQYDASVGGACLNAARAAAGQPGFCEGSVADPIECSRVFQTPSGKKPGEVCTEDIDCAPSSEGAVNCATEFTSTGTEIRKCQIEIRGTAGSSPCIWTVDGIIRSSSGTADDVAPRGYACYVSDGLRCDSTGGACVALAAIGGNCLGDSQCVKGAFCDSTSTCVARRSPGGDCSGSDFQCVSAAYCASTLMCAARLTKGAACTESAQCASDSCINNVCDPGSGNLILAFLCGNP